MTFQNLPVCCRVSKNEFPTLIPKLINKISTLIIVFRKPFNEFPTPNEIPTVITVFQGR